MSEDIIAGRNPVREALRADRAVNKILIAGGVLSGPLKEIFNLAGVKKIPVQVVDRRRLDKFVPGAIHQGVVAFAAVRKYVTLDDLIAGVGPGEEPFVFVLDQMHDPHNLGAILRTADTAGMHGVIVPRHRSARLTPAVAKASAGAVEYVPVARVANIARTVDFLKTKGFWVVGADAHGREIFWDARLDGPLALVIGGEDKGLGRLVRERCDILVRVPMSGRVNSLNASVAAALLAYEVLRQRRMKLNEAGISHS
jgi:23S rRNA (guanosine2251-2'-O)-methyltransferase